MSVLDIWFTICKIQIKKIKTMITLFKDPFFQGFEGILEPKLTTTPQITKTDEDYQLYLAVPGLTKDDLKISVKDNILSISYKEEKTDDKSYSFIRSFKKSYNIPDNVDEKQINGSVENGVLEIILPKNKKKNTERLIELS